MKKFIQALGTGSLILSLSLPLTARAQGDYVPGYVVIATDSKEPSPRVFLISTAAL